MRLGMSIAVGIGLAGLASSVHAQLLYSNGNLADLQTGNVARNGFSFAPAGTQWSEVSDNTTDSRDNVAGSTMTTGQFRLADSFTVPAGQTWNITQVKLWGYQTNGLTPTINSVTVALWSTDPQLGGTFIQGDQTTNVFANSVMAQTYRTFNTFSPLGTCAGSTTSTTRPLQEVTANVNLTNLTAGTYWLDWSMSGNAALAGPFHPSKPVKPLGSGVTFPGADALQFSHTAFVWAPALGALRQGLPGTACVTTANINPFEFPFELMGNTGGCDPDITTGAVPGQPGYGVPNGVINNDDFFYYLAIFAAGC